MILYPTDDEIYILSGSNFYILYEYQKTYKTEFNEKIAFIALQCMVSKWLKTINKEPLKINETVLG